MSERPHPELGLLDERLARAFAVLDVSADFDLRLAARLAREAKPEVVDRVTAAQRLEEERYRAARLHRGWRHEGRTLLRVATLETLGIAALIAITASAVWTPLTAWADAQMPELTDALRQNAAIVWPCFLGVLLAASSWLARRLPDEPRSA